MPHPSTTFSNTTIPTQNDEAVTRQLLEYYDLQLSCRMRGKIYHIIGYDANYCTSTKTIHNITNKVLEKGSQLTNQNNSNVTSIQ